MSELRLRITTDPAAKVARLKLARADGSHLAGHEVRLPAHSSALWEGLFDTRRYVERYQGALVFDDQTEPATAASLLDRLGRFLGQAVLGPDILGQLAAPGRKVLVVQLPTPDDDVLAAAFARVPWEEARLSDGTRLRNLVVRAETDGAAPADLAADPAADQAEPRDAPLRMLCVFAEAPGSRPLAMRSEREALRRLFAERILPHRRVEIDLLCHGVTRQRLKAAIRARRGYHLVHWSGHGQHNTLELQGEPDNRISGPDLVALFEDAGGFLPRLFFLSACHSGALIEARDWARLQAALSGDTAPVKDQPPARQLEDAYRDPSGYTGTALALIAAGVPQVVAMRYAVGDDYARRLALAFYRRLLGDGEPTAADQALALARDDLKDDPEQAAYHAVDHATPLLFGRPDRLLAPEPRRSPQLDRLAPRPQPLLPGQARELDPPAVFVGRGEALARLGQTWLAAAPADLPEPRPAVALLQGLAGLGKTALAAEAIHLFHQGFALVLAFQAKPTALTFAALMRQLDQRLSLESPHYREQCQANRLRQIHLDPEPDQAPALFPGPGQRQARMRANLIDALRAEPILLVLDNLEPCLETVETAPGSALHACTDPDLDALLAELAAALPATGSRLLVTSRHRPQALADPARVLWLPLGPLPLPEAGLYLRSHPRLRPLLLSPDPADRDLLRDLLEISRGHPLILDRLAALADDRAALAAALKRLRTDGLDRLPDLFDAAADDQARAAERAYLEDCAGGAIDLLIERLTPDARRLLIVVTLADGPVDEAMLAWVWEGRGVDDDALDQFAAVLAQMQDLPDDNPGKRQFMDLLATDQGKQMLERLAQRPDRPQTAPPIAPLLAELHGSGLLSREAPADDLPVYGYHELVRERLAAQRRRTGPAAGDPDDAAIRIAYGERHAKRFQNLYHEDRAAAAEAGSRTGRWPAMPRPQPRPRPPVTSGIWPLSLGTGRTPRATTATWNGPRFCISAAPSSRGASASRKSMRSGLTWRPCASTWRGAAPWRPCPRSTPTWRASAAGGGVCWTGTPSTSCRSGCLWVGLWSAA